MTMHLGNRSEEVKKLRDGGVSVADIAAKFGVTKATVYNDLNGKSGTERKAKRKAKNPAPVAAKTLGNKVMVSINDALAVTANGISSERLRQILGMLLRD